MSGRRRTILFLVMLLAVLVLLTGQVRGEDQRSLGPLGTGVLTALAPLQTVMARVADSLSRGWQLYTEIGRLRVESARLREEVQRLTREVTRLRETAQAARRLETLLAFKLQTPYRVVAARGIVVGRLQTLHAAASGAVFREGTGRAAVDLGRLEEVLILLPEGGPRH